MPADAAPLRILVAGAGGFGREHLARLAGRADVTVVGVADPDPAALELVRQRRGVARCLGDPLRLIDETEADAIIIAAPGAAHVEICVAALGRNLCVLLRQWRARPRWWLPRGCRRASCCPAMSCAFRRTINA